MRPVVALDLGSSKVAVLVAEVGPDGSLKVLGAGQAPSEGLRQGVVVNLEETVRSIRAAAAEAERMAGVPVRQVVVGMAGEHVRSVNSRGVIAVSREGAEIRQDDVFRVVEAARAVAIPGDRQVLHVIPQEFVVDDQAGIRNPAGMSGVRLEAEVHIVTGAVTSTRNLEKAVLAAGLRPTAFVLEPLASSRSVLTDDERNLGCLLVDIGGGTTDLAMFYDGAIRHSAVIGMGGSNVTHDLAIGLHCPMETAETLKLNHGSAAADRVDHSEFVDVAGVGGRDPKPVARHLIATIIEARMEEILIETFREARKNLFTEVIAGGVVLTGGGALLHDVEALAERIFEMPVRVGVPRKPEGVREFLGDPRFATGMGLLFSAEEEERRESQDAGLLDRLSQPVRKILGGMF